MMQFGPDFDFAKEVSEKWNKKRKSLRILSIVLAALMVLLGILFIAFPQQSLVVIERIASVVILILGVYLLVDYFQTEVFLRRPGVLIDSILNILMGLLLLFSPATITIAAFAFLFGIQMLIYGISQLVMAQQIGCFAVSGYGWMIASGIFNILAAFAFLVAPLVSAIVMNYILAVYLIVGGITLLIEAISVKNRDF